ncbi:MAG: ribonuclease R [Blastocatellia bacterium]|nr:ribonuclease R [Blastocatellia bacterium]
MKKREIPAGQIPSMDVEQLIKAISEEPDGLTINELVDIYNFNRPAQKQLTRLLNNLQGTGILRRYGNAYRWADSNRVFIGTIRQRRRKSITFLPDDDHERSRGKLQVQPEDTNGAFDGDRVIAYVTRARGNERTAKVQMLLRRGQLKVIGRLHLAHRFNFVESLDEKFPFEIDVEPGLNDEDGKIVVVEVTRYPSTHENAAGTIIERLGAFSDEPGLDIEIIIRKHDLPHLFPPEVDAESESVSPVVTDDQCVGRLDLRDVLTVTIDGETARDFDDAISLHKLDNGNYSLGVHIADVSFYVREKTALDAEAALRGTSVYFPERAIPMLPEKLSNGICSLNPKVDRLTMSALMEVNSSGKVVSYQLRETVIRSNERMTYTDVNKVLTNSDTVVSDQYADFIAFFRTMEELAQVLINMRKDRGAIDFNLPEAVFRFNDEGQIAGVLKAERNIAHRIIEEFMLLANETVAGHLERLGIPSLYRIHEQPEPQRVIEFAELAGAFGYRFPVEGVNSHDYQRLSHLLTGKPEEKVLSYAMLRSLQRARYAANNAGHFGLAAPTYTHFTSPIRRYPDLIVHRILRALLQRSPSLGDSSSVPKAQSKTRNPLMPIAPSELALIAEESSERERSADAAERELEDWRKAVLMAKHVGEEFDGLIANVREFGFFVELDELYIEGLVAVSSLTDDYYEFDSRRHTLRGRQNRKIFRLGDRVRVRVDRVNVDRHLVDFSVVLQPFSRRSRKP